MQKWPFNIEFYLHKDRNSDENHGGDRESYRQTTFIGCPRSHRTPNETSRDNKKAKKEEKILPIFHSTYNDTTL